jgi:hypothetical protein
MTAFVLACSAGWLDEAQAIYAEGAPHADALYRGLRFACMNNHLPMARWLRTVYAFFDFCRDGLFLIACFNDNLDMAEWLVDEGCDVHCRDTDGSTAMFRACCRGSLRMVEWLYGKGSTNLRVRTLTGLSLLWGACTSDNLLLCQWLYDRCPSITSVGEPPLLAACKRGRLDMVKWLLPHSNLEHANIDGHTALWFACYFGHADVAKWLVESGAEISEYATLSPVRAACLRGSVELMKFFLERGYPPGRLELAAAVERENVSMLEWLIQEIGLQRMEVRQMTKTMLEYRFARTLRTHAGFQVFLRSRLGDGLVRKLIADFVGVLWGRKLRNVRECLAFW